MKHIHYLLGALLLLAAGCNDDDNAPGGSRITLTSPVAFTSEIAAMQESASDSWADGDRVGVYMFRHGTNRIVGDASNVEYKAAPSGELTAAGEQIRFAADYDAFDFYAYYPYNAAVTNYILPLRLADQTDPLATCLLYSGDASGIAEQQTAVKLGFVHKLAKIAFAITPGAGISTADLAGLTVTAEGLDTEADFNVLSGRFSNRRNPLPVAVTVAADGRSAEIVTLPDAGVSLKLHFTLKNGLPFEWETDKTFDYAEGKIHHLDVTIGNSGVEVTPGGIEDWTGTGDDPIIGEGDEIAPAKVYAVGDLYPDAQAPEGVVFAVSDGGKHGKVVSLTEFKHRWGSFPKVEATDGVPEAANADDGFMATTNLVSVRHTAGNFGSDYAIFHWIYTEMNAGEVQGVWYLPARNELRALLAAISDLDYADIADAWTDDLAMPQFEATQSAREAFNGIITAAGGTKLNLWGTYWSSTEIDANYAWCVKFDTGRMVADKFKYDQWGPTARPIRTF